ncbi:MAG: phosphoethanolamine transferase [Phycisphaerales bacterium]|nr:phosphoethanolamine transferase [Phycisphaerales bacterium]
MTYIIVTGFYINRVLLGMHFSPLVLNALFDTSSLESLEYFTAHLSLSNIVLLVIFIILLITALCFFVQSCHSVFSLSQSAKLKFVIAISALYAFCILQNDLLWSNNMFNELKDAYALYEDEKEILRKDNYNYLNSAHKIDSYQLAGNEDENTFVLVIGESHSRNHMSLYHYPRCTNPLLSKIAPELLVFDNVVSAAQTTILSLQRMLSFATINNPTPLYTEPSLLEIFGATGYKTYWISNQQLSGRHDTWSKLYGQKANTHYFINSTNSWLNYSFDEHILPYFEQALADSTKKKLIVLHLIGSHERYDRRYPFSFDFFTTEKPLPQSYSNIDDDVKAIINQYDNSILYNDFILAECIKKLKTRNSNSCMLYISDHGEAVCEESDYNGHNESTCSRYMVEVPFIYWEKNYNTETRKKLKNYTHRPFQSDQLLNSLLDIAQIRTALYDSTKSIFSPYFVPSKRYCMGLDYDSLYHP